MKRGVPPTAVNARTGEFTPPGIRAHASAKSFAETSVLDMPPVFQQGPMRQLQGVVASPVRCEFSLRSFYGVIAADRDASVNVRLRRTRPSSFDRVVPAVRPHQVGERPAVTV